ncbi:MAG: hypothetical protein LBS39_00625 [Campylobacteraceae bacterium]|jgi:hypothetical protein|nr:hypothetical protein [Campylobacteraceae bacterium]
MNKVIIIGHPYSAYEKVEELLRIYGMAYANQSAREGFTPQQITQTLCKAHGVSSFELYLKNIKQIDVGTVWNSIVLDLMLANIDEKFWGWSDPNAIYLLNYYKSIDPNIVFVLVYDKPEAVFSHYETVSGLIDKNSIKDLMQAWNAYNLELLNFYLENQNRCLLVHSQQVSISAASYIQSLQLRIGANFEFPKNIELTVSQDKSDTADNITVKHSTALTYGDNDNLLVRYMAKAIMGQNRQSANVYKKLQASADLPLVNEGVGGIAAIDAWQAMVEQVRRSKMQDEQIQSARNAIDCLESEINKIKAEYEDAKNHIDILKQEQLEQLGNIQNRLNEQNKKANDIEKQKFELNQTLERAEKSAKEKAEQLELFKKQLEDAKKIVADKERKAKELEAKNQELQAKSQEASKENELGQENELLLSQLHQVQEELERYYLENQEFKKQSHLNHQDIAAKPKFFGAKERVKNTLEYRMGGLMIEHWKQKGKLTLLPALKKALKEWQDIPHAKLPPLEDYMDAEEGYRTQKHLSYRLGITWLNHKNILTLPKAILKDVKEFREYRRGKN